MTRTAGIVLAAVCVALPGRHAPARQEEAPSGEFRLVLEGALPQRRAGGGADARDLALDLEVREGRWSGEAWGFVPGEGKADHEGRAEVEEREDALRLRVELAVAADGTTPAGAASYAVVLRRGGARYEGRFEGRFDGAPVEGPAWGRLEPAPRRTGAAPAGPGEHPRLVFRRDDVEALRERARTREGQAIVARLRQLLSRAAATNETGGSYAAGHAFLHLLTGEARHAAAARELVDKQLQDRLGGPPAWRAAEKPVSHALALVGAALAYDLSYDEWDAAFRERVARELERKALEVLRIPVPPAGQANGILRGAAGVAALAVRGDPCAFDLPEPPDPAEPVALSAPEDFEPPPLLTPNRADEAVWTRWLAAGPFVPARGTRADFLASLGGPERARPQEGTRAVYAGQAFAFRRLDPRFFVPAPGGSAVLDVGAATGKVAPCTLYLYGVLENDRERIVRFPADGGARVWVAGTALERGDAARLGTGRFPVLLEVEVTGAASPVCPRFVETSEEREREARSRERAAWERAREAWAARGRASEHLDRAGRICERSVRRWMAEALGDRGGALEGDDAARSALVHGVFPFLAAAAAAEGKDGAAGTGAAWVLPLVAARTVLRRGGGLVALRYGPGTEVWERSVARSGDFALGLGTVQEEHLPAVLWTFNRAFGLEGDRSFDVFLPHHAVYALARYPFGVRPRAPAEALPRVLEDRSSGLYVFRNGWRNDEDIVAALSAGNAGRAGLTASPDAGSFRIRGLGSSWARLAGERGHRFDRGDENVLLVPGLLGFGRARVAFFEAEDDGSGAVTLDLDGVHRDESDADAGVRGLRAFGVDYSGRSGAPALFAVVDRLQGGPSKVWTMHPEGEVRVEGAAFTVAGPRGATLRGLFAAPAGVRLMVKGGSLVAMGGDEYFVVMTLQRGEAPAARAEGSGLEARVVVGERRIRFDGDRLRFEDP